MDKDKLKLLAVAYNIANEFDCVLASWDEDYAERVEKAYEIVDATKEQIDEAINEYNGWSCYDLTQEILSEIKKED